MGKNDVNWDAACELVKADKNRKGPEEIVLVQGLAFPMKEQRKFTMPESAAAADDGRLIIAAYWNESDEMGYGKVNYLCSVSDQMLIIVFRLQFASPALTSIIVSFKLYMMSTCSLPGVGEISHGFLSRELDSSSAARKPLQV